MPLCGCASCALGSKSLQYNMSKQRDSSLSGNLNVFNKPCIGWITGGRKGAFYITREIVRLSGIKRSNQEKSIGQSIGGGFV